MVKNIRAKHAVSEVIGVVLLLGITISLFAILNYNVFHFAGVMSAGPYEKMLAVIGINAERISMLTAADVRELSVMTDKEKRETLAHAKVHGACLTLLNLIDAITAKMPCMNDDEHDCKVHPVH